MSRDLVLEGPLGRIELTSGALASLVVRAAESVPGVSVRRPRRGLEIDVEGASARIEMRLIGPWDGMLPDVGAEVQRTVASALATTADLRASVDVTFEGVR